MHEQLMNAVLAKVFVLRSMGNELVKSLFIITIQYLYELTRKAGFHTILLISLIKFTLNTDSYIPDCKVYSQVLLNRLSKWSDENDKLSKNQFGFQKGKSTINCIFLLNAIVSKFIHSGEKLYCCFIDYEKAFNHIDRPLMWHKLIFEKASSKLVKALKSMYDVVRACIGYKSLHLRF